jgi:1-acyl-sn-glycerol-3-phosphate acyltransferase
VQWLRSLVFVGQMYAMAVLAVFFTPWAIVDRAARSRGARLYAWVRWTASWMVGPADRGAGHAADGRGPDRRRNTRAFFDIIMIVSACRARSSS